MRAPGAGSTEGVSTIARATLGARAPAAGGLTAAEAAARLARDGPNRLPAPGRVPAWRRLAAEMFHFFALLFWVAGGLAFVAGMPQLGVAVFVVVVLNALFAFVQEERAEHAAERLRDLLPRFVTVVRDGCRCRSRPPMWSSATPWCCVRATGCRPTCGSTPCTRWRWTPRR